MLESPLVSYRPQEGTPNMMIVDVGTTRSVDLTNPSLTKSERPLQIGDLVRVTDAVTDASGFGGTFRAAVRAGTVGVVESTGPMGASVRFTGYFDHPLGLPMVMERAHYEIWDYWRRELGPVQRILPTGEYAGPEESVLLMADAASTPPPARMSSALDVSSALARDVPSLEVPFASLECSNGTAWQPVSEATAKRRQAMAAMHAVTLPYLRRVSAGRRSGQMPLLGFGHGEGFLQPGGETSMAHDAPVLSYDGSGIGRMFNLLYIDEDAQLAVVGMGSASGALYSSAGSISVRMLPLADVYLPFSKLISASHPIGRLLEGPLGEAVEVLYGVSDETASAPDGTPPHFKYGGVPLPPADDSMFASLRRLFGVGQATHTLDAGVSAAHAWERLLAEFLEGHCDDPAAQAGTVELPLELFCLSVGGRDVPVYIDVNRA